MSTKNTPTQAAELALAERSAWPGNILALSPVGFAAFDQALQMAWVNPAFTTLTGLAPGQVNSIGAATLTALIASHCLPGASFKGFERLRARVESGELDARELIELADANKRVLAVGLRPGQAGSVSQLLHFRDVTRETEVDHMKSEFLSTAAHELRTPMASIYGFAEVLLTQPTDPDMQREFLTITYHKAEWMTSILNELLDLARIEGRRGKDFAFATLAVQALLQDVISDFKLPAGHQPPTGMASAAPLLIQADRKKAAQAVINVLSNAYKYSAPCPASALA